MLDLDHLASLRAQKLNQAQDQWKKAIWGPNFQKFSASMSDGEVEQLISWCPSVKHLEALTEHLLSASKAEGLTPFPLLIDIAKQAGVSPEEWIKTHLPMSPTL